MQMTNTLMRNIKKAREHGRRNPLVSLSRKTLPAGLVLLWIAGQAMAQSGGSIQGSVTDSSGAPILGAVVAVAGPDGSRRTTVTDGFGAFKISDLTLDRYNIRISASGLSDWTISEEQFVSRRLSKPDSGRALLISQKSKCISSESR